MSDTAGTRTASTTWIPWVAALLGFGFQIIWFSSQFGSLSARIEESERRVQAIEQNGSPVVQATRKDRPRGTAKCLIYLSFVAADWPHCVPIVCASARLAEPGTRCGSGMPGCFSPGPSLPPDSTAARPGYRHSVGPISFHVAGPRAGRLVGQVGYFAGP
jgi:hypothetical protein